MRNVESRVELRPLADRLRALRLARGWSMDAAARAAGVTQTTVMHAERGCVRPHPRVLEGLAQAYDLPLDELVKLAGRKPSARTHPALAGLASRIARVLELDDLVAGPIAAGTAGDLVRTARQEHGWSSSLTASRARLGHDLLVGLERDERQAEPEVLARLADVLGLERAQLLQLAGHPAELTSDPWGQHGSRGRRPHRGWLSPGGGRQANPALASSPEPVCTLLPAPEIRGPGARGSWDWTDWRKQAILRPSS